LNKKSKVRFAEFFTDILLIFTGACFVYTAADVIFKTAGIILILTGFTGIILNYRELKFIPLSFKRIYFFYFKIYPVMLLSKIMGVDSDTAVDRFIELNNRMNKVSQTGGKVLVLLPKCFQNSSCKQDLSEDVRNCMRCGKCQIPEVLEKTQRKDITVSVVNGGRLAVEKIRQEKPCTVIAVACEKELTEGIRQTFGINVWAVINIRPEGPCRNTKIKMKDFEDCLNKSFKEN